jgi:hypothetical protein
MTSIRFGGLRRLNKRGLQRAQAARQEKTFPNRQGNKGWNIENGRQADCRGQAQIASLPIQEKAISSRDISDRVARP